MDGKWEGDAFAPSAEDEFIAGLEQVEAELRLDDWVVAVNTGLARINPLHEHVWRRTTGIQADGVQLPPVSVRQTARELGISVSTAQEAMLRADNSILRALFEHHAATPGSDTAWVTSYMGLTNRRYRAG